MKSFFFGHEYIDKTYNEIQQQSKGTERVKINIILVFLFWTIRNQNNIDKWNVFVIDDDCIENDWNF